MKIERAHRLKAQTIQAFAESYDLTMRVRYRDDSSLPPVYANFARTEVKNGVILEGEFGNGDTEEEAIGNYAKAISGKLLVVNTFSAGSRMEIQAPEFLPYEPEVYL